MLSACQGEDKKTADAANASSQAVVPSQSVEPVPEPKFEPVAGVVFEANPVSFRKCEAANGVIKTELKWDVSGANVKYVDIMVSRGTAEPKLFVSGKATGQKFTGEWVKDGTKFELIQSGSQHKLGEIIIAGEDCV